MRHAKIGKGGKRADLGGKYLRSKMEANLWRYFLWLKEHGEIAECEYEPKEFEFPVKRGTRFYRPDFRITERNGVTYFLESKGYMDAKSKTQLKRMALHHPDIVVRVIDYPGYRKIAAVMSGLVPNWER